MRLALIVVAVSLVIAGFARAEDDAGCAVPAYLLTTDSPLPKVADAIKTRKQLDILVIGSGSSALSSPDGVSSSYPARLEALLRKRLTGVAVNVATDLLPKKTSTDVAKVAGEIVEKQPADRKPTLTIWQTGTVDAIRAIDPDDFRNALDSGIEALQKLGTDVLLMNLQYSPRIESMLSVAPYVDTMRVVGQQHDVPLYDRFSIMRHWSDAGDFDLFGTVHGYAMAKRVHNCVARSLSKFIIDASGIKPTELGTQR